MRRMTTGAVLIIGIIIGMAITAGMTSSGACETAQCVADRGHNAEGAFVGLAVSTILNEVNGPDERLLTFVETLVAGAAISIATEWFVGKHDMGFNNGDAKQRFLGHFAGATTWQFLTIEGKF